MRVGDLVANRYCIEAIAGAGGMGTVFRAIDRHTHEVVALKLLHLADPIVASRFEREVRMLRELTHPNIVRFLDQGRTEQGARYLAMEWLEGEPLERRLRSGALTLEETVVVARGTIAALEHASRAVPPSVRRTRSPCCSRS